MSKEALDERLLAIYKRDGIPHFLDVCAAMLSHTDVQDPEKKRKVNGEICEVVLLALTDNYIRKKSIRAKAYHSMILPNKENVKSSFRTELDFTLLTPGIILSGECKSYKGNITLTGDCTIKRGDNTLDVAKQMRLHGNALAPYLREYALGTLGGKAPPYGLFLFVYSLGTLTDNRTRESQNKFPVLQISNLYSYYDRVLGRYSTTVYDFDRAQKQFTSFTESAALHQQHRKYLGY